MTWQRLQSPQLQQRLKIRARIIQVIREFFIKEGFLEVETPILVPAAGQEPHLNPLKVEFPACHSEPTHQSDLDRTVRGRLREESRADARNNYSYLITSPEYAHKKLLAAGFGKTFEITRAFRAGEPNGGLHNPEFTMLEWYRAGADYTKIMEDVERLVKYIARALLATSYSLLKYQGKTINLSSPWQRLTVAEAFQKYADVNLDNVPDEDAFFKIFLTHIEPKLGFPKTTILYEWPAPMAALARVVTKPQKRGGLVTTQFAERFELYIAGIELANAFSELTDAKEQRRRFLEEQKLRKKLGKEIIPLDEDFLDAVSHLPPCAGIALGVDRLVMLLTNAARIEDVLAFPARELWA